MIDASSRFRGEEKALSIFAKGEPPPIMGPDRKRAYVGGVFYAGSESRESDPEVYRYNELITSLLGRWEATFVRMLKEGLGKKATRENEELKGRWRKEIIELLEESIELLKGKDIDPEKVTFTPLPLRRKRKDTSIGKDVNNRFKVYYGRLTEGKGDINLYYLDVDVANRLEDLLDGLRSGEISPSDYTEELGRLRREVGIKLIEKILECKDLEGEVRRFFESLKELGEGAVRGDDILAQLFFERLFKIEVDFHVGLAQEGEGEDGPWLTHKPLITKLGYGDTRLTYEEVLLRIGKEAVRREEFSDKPEEDLIREAEEEAESLGISEWLRKVYGDRKGNTPFLKKVRRELTRILGGGVPGVKKVSFVRDGKAVYDVEKKIYADTYRQFLLYEINLEDNAKKLLEALQGAEETGKKRKYINPKMMEGKARAVEMEFLFPFWEELKKHNSYTFTGNLAYKALAFLLQVAGFFKAIRSRGVEKKATYMVFALLDVAGDEDRYPIWDAVRAFIDHALAHPFQTLGRKSIEEIAERRQGAIYFQKNALISALRTDRRVVLRFNNLKTRKPVVYSMLVEDRSVELAGAGRHYLYSLYRFAFKDDSLTIERDDRKFFAFADGFSGDVKELEKFLMGTPNLIAITQDTRSPLLSYGKLNHESFFPVLYRSIKTPLLLKGAKRDKNAYVIFEKEFKKGLRYMGWLGGNQNAVFEDYNLFVIRAPLVVPSAMRDEPYMSTELSLFFVGNLKGDNPEVEEGILLSLLGWLVWGSESFSFLYAKPKFMPLKLPKAVVRRMNRDYTVPLGASVLELAYIMKRAEEKTQG
ncbi:hypothetical protein [Hydrogenivirga sp. 128-5-R1-1]|uniref:hypothetical protein n=1 Tax=Hydrogenivirga sp. 128-5-R1-1 TaxID=392423 RepID=UPI00015EF047|nr:hypothetical protein [Hydrogenivirga sp. 128-5-R1-1]EDP74682.1 hypothetical protein HG1285_14759 [Hydrogenivirga sp. 128-5-R1-1]